MPQASTTPQELYKQQVADLYRSNGARKAGSFGARLDEWLQADQRRQIVESAKFGPGMRVLDVGAGQGYLSRVAKDAGAHVTAVDVVDELADGLATIADVVLRDDVDSLRLDDQYDRVLLIGVLEFVENPEAVLHKLSSYVAPGGLFLMLAPVDSIFGYFYLIEKRLKGIKVGLFDPAWCESVCNKAGVRLAHKSQPWPTNVLMAFERPVSSAAL